MEYYDSVGLVEYYKYYSDKNRMMLANEDVLRCLDEMKQYETDENFGLISNSRFAYSSNLIDNVKLQQQTVLSTSTTTTNSTSKRTSSTSTPDSELISIKESAKQLVSKHLNLLESNFLTLSENRRIELEIQNTILTVPKSKRNCSVDHVRRTSLLDQTIMQSSKCFI